MYAFSLKKIAAILDRQNQQILYLLSLKTL